jgi:hypothetical protein
VTIGRRWLPAVVFVGLVAFVVALLPAHHQPSPPAFAAPRSTDDSITVPRAVRDDALRRARVWRKTDPASFDFSVNPPDPSGLLSGPVVNCRYLRREQDGTTTKFHCVLADGEVVKVKYGGTAEIQAEVAASRLLTALGFGADRMFLVPRVRCYGCGRTPFHTGWVLDKVRLREVVTEALPDDRYTEFAWPAIERKFPAVELESEDVSGWGWFELGGIDSAEGASRAELDALRLAAILIAHWDNKAENQRLACLDLNADPGRCRKPFAFIQDLGSTFGPRKVDLDGWKRSPIWTDAGKCLVSMRDMPHDGAPFADAAISEEGRQLLAHAVGRLSDAQVVTLFSAARFPEYAKRGAAADARAWADLFHDKVRQITERAPCPSWDSTDEARSAPPSGT